MPRIVIDFQAPTDTRFRCKWTDDGPVSESQLEIAGQELLAVARRMRELRLSQQMPLVQNPPAVPPAPPAPPAPPIPPVSTDPAGPA